jgi:hypothetical protein
MIIHIDGNRSIDTDRDLSAAERHVLQKLFGWKTMVESVDQFRRKTEESLRAGWNNSGPIDASAALALVIQQLEKELELRLKSSRR